MREIEFQSSVRPCSFSNSLVLGLARAAIEWPVQIRKLWRSGPEDRPPEWRPGIYSGADGEPCLDEPFSILAGAALALARTGSTSAANQLLQELHEQQTSVKAPL